MEPEGPPASAEYDEARGKWRSTVKSEQRRRAALRLMEQIQTARRGEQLRPGPQGNERGNV